MDWTPEIEQLAQLRRLRKRMGGAESIARQHAQGRLTVRERVDLLVDADSFQETSTSAGAAKWSDDGRLESFRPMAYVTGQANIDGRPVILEGGDFTIRGGASDSGTPYPRVEVTWLAGEPPGVPFIRLLDGAGGSVRNYDPEARRAGGDPTMPPGHAAADEGPLVDVKPTGTPGSFDLPKRHDFSAAAPMAENSLATEMAKGNLLAQVPVVAVVLGSVAGLPAVRRTSRRLPFLGDDQDGRDLRRRVRRWSNRPWARR